jgi:hypothetical protein
VSRFVEGAEQSRREMIGVESGGDAYITRSAEADAKGVNDAVQASALPVVAEIGDHPLRELLLLLFVETPVKRT